MRSSYLHIHSDGAQRLDLSTLEFKLRATGATANALVSLADGTNDPVAVCLTRYKYWDIVAPIVIAAGAGCSIHEVSEYGVSGASISLGTLLRDSVEGRPLLVIGPQCDDDTVQALRSQVKLKD